MAEWSQMDLLVVQTVKNFPAMQETWVRSLDQEDPLEKGTATHSSSLAWRIPWTEETGGLQSIGSQRVGHDCATNPKQENCVGTNSASAWLPLEKLFLELP